MLSSIVSASNTNKNSEKTPLLSGLFFAPELCTGGNSWNADDWVTAFGQMKEAGMDIAVLQYAVQYYSDTYKVHYYEPKFEEIEADNTDKHNQIPYALEAAKKVGIKVYLGLHIAESPWFSAMSAGFSDTSFLKSSYNYSKSVAEDIWKQFGSKYDKQIEGWYLPFEYNNSEVLGPAEDRLIENFYIPMTSYLKKSTPNKKILVSPLVYAPLTSKPSKDLVDNWYKLSYDIWTKTNVDIIAPQDGCGWESTVKDTLDPWYDALDRAYKAAKNVGKTNIEAWNNPECYNMNGTSTMTMKRLIANMSAVDKYVSKHVSFSAASLLFLAKDKNGVNENNKSYYEAYKYIYENKKLYAPTKDIETPKKLSAEVTDGVNITLKWSRVAKSGDMPIAGYYIFRKDTGDFKRVKEVEQSSGNIVKVIDYSLTPGDTYSYKIYAFDGTGNVSKKPAEATVTVKSDTKTVNHKNTDELQNYKLSLGESVNSKVVFGDIKRLSDQKYALKLKTSDTDNGNVLLIKKTDDKKSAKSDIDVKFTEETKVGFVYIQMLTQPTKDVYLPERIDVKSEDKILKTVYPLREYGNLLGGGVWLPIDFNDAVNIKELKIQMIMKQKFIAVSEIKIYAATNIAANSDYICPSNKIEGQPVMITNYTTEKNFSPDYHFGGVKMVSIDYEKGNISDKYIMFKECYSSYNITRGTSNPAMLRWTEDPDKSHWLSIANIGKTYELKVDFKAPTTVNSLETIWMYDRDAAVFLPTKVEYYGTTLEGHSELIGTSYPPSLAKIDFDKPPSSENTHFISTEKYVAVNPNKDTIYKQVTAKVFPEYAKNIQFISNFTVY